MLRFAVYDEAGPANDWPLRQAHLLGPDGVAVLGAEIVVERGMIDCDKRSKGSAALALQWDAGPPGVLTLETCLLPDRPEPYLLSLELARRRIMLFLVKLEEWSLFDLPATDPVMSGFEEAHRAFTAALIAHRPTEGGFTVEQDRLARTALTLAIEAGERLALRHARDQTTRRFAGAAAAAGPILGCAVFTDHFSEPLRNVVADSFDFISMPMRWSELEPEEGTFQCARIDKWVEWAVRTANMPVVGGPLIDFRPRCVPDWLYIWENDYETLRELVYEHVKRVLMRYRRAISRWTIVSGLHINTNFSFALEQVIDLTRLCVLMVRKIHPGAKIAVEVAQPFGEYSAQNPQSIPPLLYTELLFQAGVSVDSIGLRLEMGDAEPGRATRDLMLLSDILDRFSEFEKPLALSSFGAPSAPAPEETLGADRRYDPGYWRQPWSETTQADWLARAAAIALSKPMVQSVCWQELADKPADCEMPAGALITNQGHPKMALRRMAELRKRIRERRPLDDLLTFEPAQGRAR